MASTAQAVPGTESLDIPGAPAARAVLPGGIGLSSLTVYTSGGVDGHMGGSPHVHLTCSEAYYVVAGRGWVQTLSATGYQETELRPGVVVHFDPGTIHRLLNDAGLHIIVMMQNGGLPEAGDAVLTLPQNFLGDRDRYAGAVRLRAGAEQQSAMDRRDLAVRGFAELLEAWRLQGADALEPFYAAATEIVRPYLGEWRRRWRDGAGYLVRSTGEQLDALAMGDHSHLSDARLHVQAQPEQNGRWGMCGHLDTYAATAAQA